MSEEEPLFDDLMSPGSENKSFADVEDSGDQLSSKDNVSLENILLETSTMEESIDLSTSTVAIDIGGDLKEETNDDQDLLTSDDVAGEIVPDTKQTETGVQEMVAKTEHNDLSGGEHTENVMESHEVAAEISKADICDYFQTSRNDSATVDIFDSLVANTAEKLSMEDKMVPKNSAVNVCTGNSSKVHIRLESHSSVSEDVTTVDFLEDKGDEPLKPTPSTRSLTKFFSTADSEVGDDAKSFFDTFTIGENNANTNLSGSAADSSGVGQSLAESGVSIPPETPPIPVGSPMPSPFHKMSAPTSSGAEQHPFLSDQQDKTEINPDSQQQGSPQAGDPGPFLESGPDDPFTLGLNISDIDRRHDAWIPSESTRQVLIWVMTSQPGSVTLQPEQMTMPGLIQDEPLGDPVQDLVQRYMGDVEAQKRVCLTADSVPQDETGLRQLIKAECLRSAVDLTGRLLTQCGQGLGKVNTPTKHTPYTLQLWYCRLALLVHLRLYAHADSECQAFENMDKPDLYYEFYQDKYPGRRGSMVPFGMRVIHAELAHHLGKTQESLDRLYYLHAIVKKIISNLESGLTEDGSMLTLSEESRKASRELWEAREIQLLYSVANCLLSIKAYNTALMIFQQLLKKDKKCKSKILCAMARIYLHLGDTQSGSKLFACAEKISDGEDKSQNFMNMGFLALAQSQFQEAYNYFKNAASLHGNNATALNNMAVCALYTGHLTDALDTLEELVKSNPDVYLQEGILFNLCTLYELESSHAIFKKQKLLSLVSKHKGNGFNVACLKMA